MMMMIINYNNNYKKKNLQKDMVLNNYAHLGILLFKDD